MIYGAAKELDPEEVECPGIMNISVALQLIIRLCQP